MFTTLLILKRIRVMRAFLEWSLSSICLDNLLIIQRNRYLPLGLMLDDMLKKVSPLGMMLFMFLVRTFLGGVLWILPNGARSQTNMLERFDNLLTDYDNLAEAHVECPKTVRKLVTACQDLEHTARLYTDAINRLRTVREEHARCRQRIQILEKEKNYLSFTIHDQAARILLLEAELAKQDSALT
uniref:Uncharacterized protein n=1 Tax=Tanacetum cinerariifolium TaxID=118510 RepID=A0A699QI69_TANCI|nr:hypothetical protein [Tanacetum cinerariifolium]